MYIKPFDLNFFKSIQKFFSNLSNNLAMILQKKYIKIIQKLRNPPNFRRKYYKI